MTYHENVTCNECRRSFSRLDHLQRHRLTHSDVSAHKCPRCRRPFKRKDALTRHMTTCSRLSALSVVDHDRACYRCASKKRKCGHQKPSCRSCTEIGYVCRYPVQICSAQASSVQAQDAKAPLPNPSPVDVDTDVVEVGDLYTVPTETQWEFAISLTTPDGPSASASDIAQPDPKIDMALQPYFPSLPPATSFPFLTHFTAQYSLIGCFKPLDRRLLGYPDDRSLAINCAQEFNDETNGRDPSGPATFARNLPAQSDLQSRVPTTLVKPLANQFLSQIETLELIAKKSCEICSAIRKLSADWSDHQQLRCLEFFSPDHIVSALDLYWSLWYPNWPVIHRPSFRIEQTPTPLLAAMVVMGTCHSNPEDARFWFDAVEVLTFNDLQWTSGQSQYRRIQSIQAAYLVCIYQTWDGGRTGRIRIQRHRFREIVSAVRELNMRSFRHDKIGDFEHFDWTRFIQQEESIRTLLWVFLLDTAFVIFNSVPPQFALRELSMELASCEASFQASSARDCFDCLQNWLLHNPRPPNLTLYGLIKLFFRKQLSDAVLNHLAHESFMNLWCVVGAFHVILFNLDPSLGGEDQLVTLRTGIDTWESIWRQRSRNNDERFFDLIVTTAPLTSRSGDEVCIESWKKPGFWKNAAEYWLLAHLILERMVAAHESAMAADELSGMTGMHLNVGPYLHDGMECTDMRSLHSFLLTVGT